MLLPPADLVQETADTVEVLPETDGSPPVVAGVGLRATVYSRGLYTADGIEDVLRRNPSGQHHGDAARLDECGGEIQSQTSPVMPT